MNINLLPPKCIFLSCCSVRNKSFTASDWIKCNYINWTVSHFNGVLIEELMKMKLGIKMVPKMNLESRVAWEII
ncbi:hypothetical protein HanPSC8_Chr13g0552381 [Helianthus annuus]|nr:hypothetical protein HanPSC8_Chr13g0552381 [Helianthus annuus]